jgi:hypothetical protein
MNRYPVLCSNYESIPDEKSASQHLYPLIPAAVPSNLAGGYQLSNHLKYITTFRSSRICRRSAVNLQVILSKADSILGCIYPILYN